MALFAGAGGGILGGILLGWRTICAVEIDPYCRRVLLARQRDGILPAFPIWDDIRTFDGNPWRGHVDVVSGGFPCQDISCAGKGKGINGERSGLWSEMARVVREVGPRYVFVENSATLLVRGIQHILSDLAQIGYDASWGVFSGRNVGAPIERERIFIACAHQKHGAKRLGYFQTKGEVFGKIGKERPDFWLQTPSERFGMGDGMDSYLDQVAAIGNGQIPCVAALAWRILNTSPFA